MKHKYYEKHVDVIDPETGEIIGNVENEKRFVYTEESDKFYMTFFEFMAPVYKLKGENVRNILAWLCENAEFNTGKVYLPAPRVDELSQFLHVPKQSIYNGLNELKKSNLISGARGCYQINPEIFWKGDFQSRKQCIENNRKLSIIFKIDE